MPAGPWLSEVTFGIGPKGGEANQLWNAAWTEANFVTGYLRLAFGSPAGDEYPP